MPSESFKYGIMINQGKGVESAVDTCGNIQYLNEPVKPAIWKR